MGIRKISKSLRWSQCHNLLRISLSEHKVNKNSLQPNFHSKKKKWGKEEKGSIPNLTVIHTKKHGILFNFFLFGKISKLRYLILCHMKISHQMFPKTQVNFVRQN